MKQVSALTPCQDGHKYYTRALAYIKNTKLIVSGSYDKRIKVCNYETGECIRTLEGHNDSVSSVTQIKDAALIATGNYD